MTLKGQARTDYMRDYMRRRRGSPLAAKAENSDAVISLEPHALTGSEVEVTVNPASVKPRLVRPISRHDQAQAGTKKGR